MTTASDDPIPWDDHRLRDLHPRQRRVLRALVREAPTTVPDLAEGIEEHRETSVRSALYELEKRGVAAVVGHDPGQPNCQLWDHDL